MFVISVQFLNGQVVSSWGHLLVPILDWWKSAHIATGIPFKYSKMALRTATANAQIPTLNWWAEQAAQSWFASKYKLLYDDETILPSVNNRQTLEWWAQHPLPTSTSQHNT